MSQKLPPLCLATNGRLMCRLRQGHHGCHVGARFELFYDSLASATMAARCARALAVAISADSARLGTVAADAQRWVELAPELWLRIDDGAPTALVDASALSDPHARRGWRVCEAMLRAHYPRANASAWWARDASGCYSTDVTNGRD